MKTLLLAWRTLHATSYPESYDSLVHDPIAVLNHLMLHLTTLLGIRVIEDIYIDGRLHDLEVLRERFGLMAKDHFTYCRIQHLLKHCPPPVIKLLKQLLLFYSSTPAKRKGISLIFNILQEKLTFHKSKPF